MENFFEHRRVFFEEGLSTKESVAAQELTAEGNEDECIHPDTGRDRCMIAIQKAENAGVVLDRKALTAATDNKNNSIAKAMLAVGSEAVGELLNKYATAPKMSLDRYG